MSACQTEITNYLDDYMSSDDAFTAVDELTDIIREMERYSPEEYYNLLLRKLKEMRRNYRITLEEDGRCPECGEELEEEVETETGYLDGRPAYQVSEVVGRYCPECGWEE